MRPHSSLLATLTGTNAVHVCEPDRHPTKGQWTVVAALAEPLIAWIHDAPEPDPVRARNPEGMRWSGGGAWAWEWAYARPAA